MNNARRSPWRFLFKFHRYTGLGVGIIVLMLSFTGIALNHTDDLKLDRQFVELPALLDWYGISAAKMQTSFAIQQQWITQAEQQIYLDARPVYKTTQILVGATINSDYITLAFSDSLLLLTLEGKIIEQIPKSSIDRIAADDENRIYIKSQDHIYVSDDDLLSWKLSDQSPLQWSSPGFLPTKLHNKIKASSRQNILPYERVMLDIHSGRFFGTYGIYIIDLAGILLVLLTISGTWMWLRHLFRNKHRHHHTKKK